MGAKPMFWNAAMVLYMCVFSMMIVWQGSLCAGMFRIVSPIKEGFGDEHYDYTKDIPHNVALFGRPSYGGNLIGNIYLVAESNRDGCRAFTEKEMPTRTEDEGKTFIFMMSRGGCHFVEKVRNAQKAFGVGTVIYSVKDDDTDLLPVMADDGTAEDVHIPSVIIHSSDANQIMKLLRSQEITVSLQWKVPHPDNRVEWSLWRSSRSRDLHGFLKGFLEVFRSLGNHTQFVPHYEVYSGATWGCAYASCKKSCLYDDAFCLADPENDVTKGLDGQDVLQESVRQLCIWKQVNETLSTSTSSLSSLSSLSTTLQNNQGMESKIRYWQYVLAFNEECSVPAATSKEFNQECSEKIQKKTGLDVLGIRSCVEKEGQSLLSQELVAKTQYGIYSVPRLIVNDVTHYGDLNCQLPIDLGSCAPLTMICSGFQEGSQPSACTTSFWKSKCYLPLELDDCGECNVRLDTTLWNAKCLGCDGVLNSRKKLDICGVCDGTGSFDQCNQCLQANDTRRDATCLDCQGVLHGKKVLDPCGKCGGHGSFDACGVCLPPSDVRRQDYACRTVEDPNAVQIKLALQALDANEANEAKTSQVITALKQETMAFCPTSRAMLLDDVVIQSVVERRSEMNRTTLDVLLFLVLPSAKDKADVLGCLLSHKEELEKRLLHRLTALDDKIQRILVIGGLVPPTAAQPRSQDESTAATSTSTATATSTSGAGLAAASPASSTFTWSSYFFLLLGIVTLTSGCVYGVLYYRERRMRHEMHQLFSKYTPLVSVSSDETNDDV